MNIPTGVTAIAQQIYEKFPDLPNGTDEQRRELIRRIAETVASRFGPRWGVKKAGEHNPQSKDSLAYVYDDRTFDSWDTQNGATKALQLHDGQPPDHHIGPPQEFIPVEPIDHLAPPAHAPTLPPPPATVAEAMRQANQIAYDFEKHTDPDYWDRYPDDPEYFWKRMLGWQAGGDDVARYGLYAHPPSPWHAAASPVDPGDTDEDEDTGNLPLLMDALTQLRLEQLKTNDLLRQQLDRLGQIRDDLANGGKLLGQLAAGGQLGGILGDLFKR